MLNLTELRTKIYTIGQTLSLSNGIYYNVASSRANYPHAVYYLPTDPVNRVDTFGNDEHDFLVQFNWFDRYTLPSGNNNDAVSLEAAVAEFINAFNAADLNILTSYRLMDKKLELIRPAQLIDEDQKYWQILCQYSLSYHKL